MASRLRVSVACILERQEGEPRGATAKACPTTCRLFLTRARISLREIPPLHEMSNFERLPAGYQRYLDAIPVAYRQERELRSMAACAGRGRTSTRLNTSH